MASNHTAVSILPELNTNYLTMEVSEENQNSLSYFKDRIGNLNSQQKGRVADDICQTFF